MQPTPHTDLQAVNVILRNMGEAPVNSLTGDLPYEAFDAKSTLEEVSSEVQSRGWFFNTEYMTLSPDISGKIQLPGNVVEVRLVDGNAGTPVTIRGGLLYNMTPYNHGTTWTAAVKAKLVLCLDFNDLPVVAKRYVALRAARVYQARAEGDQTMLQEDTQDERAAYADLHATQLRAEPVSLAQSPEVQRLLYSSDTPYNF